MSYNLLEKDWIPVLWKTGQTTRVNIIKALTEAHRIRQIAATNPMDRVAILRFLLALLYWCEPDPDESGHIPGFPEDLTQKLNDHKDQFELFSTGNSFYQDQQADGSPVPAIKLLHDLPSGTNIAHFRHLRDFLDGLCPACCALGLLRLSCFATASKKGPREQMTAGLHGNTPAYIIWTGRSLFQTFRLNRITSHTVKGDAPAWDGASESSPLGILKCLTWQSRRVLLAPPGVELSAGKCCYCGQKTDQLVKCIRFRPGWKRPSKEPWEKDPHLFRIPTKNKRGKEELILPRAAGPDDATEMHAEGWQTVHRGMLQRSDLEGTQIGRSKATLVATSQELYKDAIEYSAWVRGSDKPNLQSKLDLLKELTWRIASARPTDWHRRPQGHWLIEELCPPAAKGLAIRSSLNASSSTTQWKLEREFSSLESKGAQVDSTAVDEWEKAAVKVLCDHCLQAVDLTTKGSPLRRVEARARAKQALNAARKIQSQNRR